MGDVALAKLFCVLHPLPGTNSLTLAAFNSESTAFQSEEPVVVLASWDVVCCEGVHSRAVVVKRPKFSERCSMACVTEEIVKLSYRSIDELKWKTWKVSRFRSFPRCLVSKTIKVSLLSLKTLPIPINRKQMLVLQIAILSLPYQKPTTVTALFCLWLLMVDGSSSLVAFRPRPRGRPSEFRSQ